MKILNWVHRKLHLNTSYSQVSQKNGVVKDTYVGNEGNLGKSASPKKALEQDTEALLLQDVLNGILTIGTLGHNHSFLADQTNCHAAKEEEPDLEQLEDHDQEVVMQAEETGATDHAAVGAGKHLLRVVELSTIKARVSLEEQSVGRSSAAGAAVVPETKEILELPLLMEDKEKLERRTTLADLFAAEPINASAAAGLGEKASKPNNYIRINSSSGQQEGAADQKKLIMKQRKKNKWEQKPSSSTPMKFQKLITRVLKKKIYPADMVSVAAAAKDQDAAKERSYIDQKPRHSPLRAP